MTEQQQTVASVTQHSDAPLLDTLASLARTALDDPAGVEEELETMYDATRDPSANTLDARRQRFAIDRLDDIIETLNPSVQSRESFARAATMLGRQLATLADECDAQVIDAEPEDADAYRAAAVLLNDSLDTIDAAVTALKGEGGNA